MLKEHSNEFKLKSPLFAGFLNNIVPSFLKSPSGYLKNNSILIPPYISEGVNPLLVNYIENEIFLLVASYFELLIEAEGAVCFLLYTIILILSIST